MVDPYQIVAVLLMIAVLGIILIKFWEKPSGLIALLFISTLLMFITLPPEAKYYIPLSATAINAIGGVSGFATIMLILEAYGQGY